MGLEDIYVMMFVSGLLMFCSSLIDLVGLVHNLESEIYDLYRGRKPVREDRQWEKN